MPHTHEEQVGQMFLVGFHGLEAPAYLLDWLREGRAGGVILFARNVESPAQVARLCQQIHDAAKYPTLIAIDQEGGIVARLREGFTESPGAMALSTADDPILTTDVSAMLAREMRALGINWTYAPVVDITYNADNPTVGTRSFGADKEQVSRMAVASVKGFQTERVAACAKHFPGLGNTSVDTHLALPQLDVDPQHILLNDLVPYRALIEAGIATVMTTHTIFTQLDADHPATLSPVIVKRLLRDELDFDGVVTTDCMEMKAIADHYGAGDSAVLAANAGVDLILFSHTPQMQAAAYDVLLAAVKDGQVTAATVEAANRRIKTLKDRFAVDAPPDLDVIRSQAHLELAQRAARAGTALVRGEPSLLPLTPDAQTLGLVEFEYFRASNVEEEKPSAFHQTLAQIYPAVEAVRVPTRHAGDAVRERALALASAMDVLIVTTRSAHFHAADVAFANRLIETAQRSVLICLRNPYDAGAITGADVVLCTNNDGAPSLQAAVDALRGVFTPQGKLPVTLRLEA